MPGQLSMSILYAVNKSVEFIIIMIIFKFPRSFPAGSSLDHIWTRSVEVDVERAPLGVWLDRLQELNG